MASGRGGDPWRGAELFERSGWRRELGPDQLDALRAFLDETTGRPAEEIGREEALLPGFAGLAEELEHGGGAVLLRRLPVEQWDQAAIERAFWGLALQLGTPVSQSAEGKRLFDVRDAGYAPGDPRFRGPMSNKKLSFHTDRCDVIGFCSIRKAMQGGDTFVVSSAALYEELCRRDPETAEVLRGPFPYLRHTVDRGNVRPYVELPVFSETEGYFGAHFLRVLIDRADRSDDAPSLTDRQRAALDALEALAEEPAMHVSFSLEPGEMLFLNNWTTFHRRSEFVDAEAPELKRHLLRIWLSTPNSRPIDVRFVEHFGAVEAGALRGGMRPLES